MTPSENRTEEVWKGSVWALMTIGCRLGRCSDLRCRLPNEPQGLGCDAGRRSLGGAGHVTLSPANQFAEHRDQIAPARRRMIFLARRAVPHRRINPHRSSRASRSARMLVAIRSGEARKSANRRLSQKRRVAHHQQRPAITEEVERPGDRGRRSQRGAAASARRSGQSNSLYGGFLSSCELWLGGRDSEPFASGETRRDASRETCRAAKRPSNRCEGAWLGVRDGIRNWLVTAA